jgi:hypothetical protein
MYISIAQSYRQIVTFPQEEKFPISEGNNSNQVYIFVLRREPMPPGTNRGPTEESI